MRGGSERDSDDKQRLPVAALSRIIKRAVTSAGRQGGGVFVGAARLSTSTSKRHRQGAPDLVAACPR